MVGFLAKGSACECAIKVTILMQHFYPSLCTCACASVCSAFSFLLVVEAGSFKQMIVDVVVAVCLPHRSFMLALAAHQVVGHLRSNIYKDFHDDIYRRFAPVAAQSPLMHAYCIATFPI